MKQLLSVKNKALLGVLTCITLLLLVGCADTTVQKEKTSDKETTEASTEKKGIDISSDFSCFFSTFDPECIQFELQEKEKLLTFFDDEPPNGTLLEPTAKPRQNSAFANQPFTIFWSDRMTGGVVYEITYEMSVVIGEEIRQELYYIELTDYKNDRKLFLDNTTNKP